ncbi:MAG: hypothetical protein HKO66_04450 [Saprospiraceae bacterium]|nr:OB-fold putative lipoprotein [Bacteroidia bacterium]NNL91460.1 hypothetical protein [Saprospiraceae bacterium]
MKKLVKFLLSLIAILAIGYYVLINLPKAKTKSKEAKITIEANDLFAAYAKNEKFANNKFNGIIIEVSGIVRKVFKDKKDDTVIILQTEDAIGGILCTLEQDPDSLPNEGRKVRIKGQCSGLLMDVVLNKCIILE